jgi:hypothetical protein
MIVPDTPITPAVYGIVIDSHLSRKIISDKWSEMTAHVFNKECKLIYEPAFDAMIIAQRRGGRKPMAFDLFRTLLHDDILASEEWKDILRAVFDFYWQLKEVKYFWQNSDFSCARLEDLIECKIAISEWQAKEKEKVEKAKAQLREWSTNT